MLKFATSSHPRWRPSGCCTWPESNPIKLQDKLFNNPNLTKSGCYKVIVN
jgi:hypothetical protein